MNSFSFDEAVSFGWNTFKSRPWFILGTISIYFVILLLGSTIINGLVRYGLPEYVAGALRAVIGLILSVSLIKVYLGLVDRQNPSFKDLIIGLRMMVGIVLGGIVFGFLVFVGFILLIVPGIIVATRLQLWQYFMVAEKIGPVEAMRRSWSITQGQTLQLLGFGFVLMLINLLGLVLLLVGLVITFPVTLLATAFIFRKLQQGMEMGENPILVSSSTPAPAVSRTQS